MKACYLMAAAIPALLAATPAFAQDSEGPGNGQSSLEIDLRYANNVDTSVVTDVTYTKDVALRGTITLRGNIRVDSSAVAVTDAKQILAGNQVNYREENELNGENGFVSQVFGNGVSESGQDPNDGRIDGVLQPAIRVGFFAPIINTINPADVSGTGNIGLNMAAGYFNMQMNSASLAVSSNSDAEANGGWAEASTTSFQSALGVRQQATPGDVLNEDDPESGGGANNFRDRNTVLGGTISGAGNLGVNAAAGSFNQQANLMTLAVATDATLAEANAALIQTSLLSSAEQQDSINFVDGGAISGSGNIGVNLASGVGNQQLNALTVATSSAGSSPGGGNGGGGGDPS